MVSFLGAPDDEDEDAPEIAVSRTQFGRTIMMEKGSATAWLSTTVAYKPERWR